MRWIALLLALLGGAACAAIGVIWKEQLHGLFQLSSEIQFMIYALLAALPLGTIAGFFAFYRRRGIALLLLVLSAALPVGFTGMVPADAGNTPLAFVAAAASPFLLCALLVLLMKNPPRRKPEVEQDELSEFDEDEEEQPEEEAVEETPAAPPPTPIAKIKCPKCVTVLKIPNPQTIKPVKCPKCQAAFRIPPAIVEKAQRDAEAAAPPPPAARITTKPKPVAAKSKPKPAPTQRPEKKTSAVALVLMLLLVGGSTAFSVAVALELVPIGVRKPRFKDEVAKDKRPDSRDKPSRDKPSDDEPSVVLDAAEHARLDKLLQERVAGLAEREKPLLESLRTNPGRTEKQLLTLSKSDEAPRGLIFTPDAKRLVTWGDHFIQVWDMADGKLLHTFGDKTQHLMALAVTEEGKTVIACHQQDKEGTIHRWDLTSGMAAYSTKLTDACPRFTRVAFTPDGTRFAYHLQNGAKLLDCRNPANPAVTLSAVTGLEPFQFAGDNRTLVSYSAFDGNGKLEFWNVETSKKRSTAVGMPHSFALLPDARWAATSTNKDDKYTLALHEVGTAKPPLACEEGGLFLRTLVFTPDGSFLAGVPYSDEETGVILWDRTGKVRHRIKNLVKSSLGNAAPQVIAFSPGGSLLATADYNGVRVWSMADLLDPNFKQPTSPATTALQAVEKVAKVIKQPDGLMLQLGVDFTDKDMEHLKQIKSLRELAVFEADKLTEAGLAHLADLTAIRWLGLGGDSVTDATLAHLTKMKGLKTLVLSNVPNVKGNGFKSLEGNSELKRLDLSDSGLKEAALEHLKALTSLNTLVTPSGVSDVGLAHLEKIPNLKELTIQGERMITDAGVEKLMKALPNLKIYYKSSFESPAF